ncbi:MAG: 3-phosphoserine/phosphohydroxythreonine transaminase [Kiritimatiellae bacterium]|jgi:phosphoserine aminotransferase|nr:3-phosphoserine/phosphohydroxythreonine transaminase [Kiritimatiellia bacterium]NLD88944.1 3-phosphoserine/phosphohydroxythreonine transaminase [Lentisphaerota bacterium]HOU21810.1 3-phosphoserine/phosphohydroxythreonine transaminase [Kiritimatiellia bacterium]HPC20295.1 3-phosphoserine/phosphohydroxythreonine transaminase [Kiritimatiellia bacterium]HQQ59930.1 3-phosphoserine/phosphohydroxythreonine transaminase [Kiritimatiellia bacterium]
MSRAYNFNAGPAVLPLEVLETARREMTDFNGTGMSIMEHSHRGKAYDAVHAEAIANLGQLLGVTDDYQVLFLQGGASLQFSMVPMNLLGAGQAADYVNTGAWAGKAIKEAKKVGPVNILADTSKDIPTTMPDFAALPYTPGAAYVHVTSNETIAGTQIQQYPRTEAPLVADMSSDILSRVFDLRQFGLIYAGAQKNLGPSGVTLVVIRKDLAERAAATLPTMLQYRTHMADNSLYNTPPTFGIYILMLVSRWLLAKGGAAGMEQINRAKADKLYAAIDQSGGFYRGTAVKEFRSIMNITWRLPSEDLEAQFIKEATALKMSGLKGHRSVGGIRASIYNACPAEAIDALIAFMGDFQARNG